MDDVSCRVDVVIIVAAVGKCGAGLPCKPHKPCGGEMPHSLRLFRLRLFTGILTTVDCVSRGSSRRRMKFASIIIRVAVSRRLVLPGTLPRKALTTERSQVGINLPSSILPA